MIQNLKVLWVAVVLSSCSIFYASNDIVSASQEISFSNQIRPIFLKHCAACHGGVKQAGGLSFVYEDQITGEDSWVVEAGFPNESLIIEKVTSDDPDLIMPPPEHGAALSDRDIGLLKQWIKEGAQWGEHWSFVKPMRPTLPDVDEDSWPVQELDYFVLSFLESKQIRHSKSDAPARWLRRVSLDLIGVPPTIDEQQQFLFATQSAENNDVLEAVYAAEVDRLLASPNYGERWASVWLDQIRYADSKGLGADGRRSIWKYRDWVISALNRDMPFDEFTTMQIAGDLIHDVNLEALIATASQRLTQTNEEGGTDDEEFRIAAVLDRVNTTWQTWQGITFGCVQCHSHPYDPFRHEEYYEFAAFFNNTSDCDLGEEWPTIQVPLDVEFYSDAQKIDNQIERLQLENWQPDFAVLTDEKIWKPIVDLGAATNNNTKVVVDSNSERQQFHTVDTVSSNTDFTLIGELPKSVQRLSAIKLTALPLDPETASSDSEWGFSLSHVVVELLRQDQEPLELKIARLVIDEPAPFFDPQQSLDANTNAGFAAYTRIYQPRAAALVLESPVEINDTAKIKVILKHRVYILAAFPLIIRRGYIEVTDTEMFRELESHPSYRQKQEELATLKAARQAIPSTTLPVLRERPEHLARQQHVFVRGLFLNKGELVAAGTPDVLTSHELDVEPDRLNLAKWLVSPDNPLTARVVVNRVWARLFGIGIVATEEDFGSSGDPPSHPKLLDHLAVKFQGDFGWRQKKLLREIVLSATYRQDSAIRNDIDESDPQNRWLARGPRHRLPAETIRDQALFVSGLLSPKMFGPPVHPPIPAGVWKPFSAGDKWSTPKSTSEDRYRRSLYTYTKRSIPYPLFAAFDSPSREFCQPRRLRSNTPVQALMMLNDETISDCRVAFAKRIFESGDSDRQRVRNGFLMAVCREPNSHEIDVLIELLDQCDDDGGPLRFQSVASVLLNLDEVFTK